MKPEEYLDLKDLLIKKGYADEIDWAENLKKQIPFMMKIIVASMFRVKKLIVFYLN